MIMITMTSQPDSETSARARLIALLRASAKLPRRNAYRGTYQLSAADECAWNRADEQERRRMLKDCGWL